MYGRNNSQVLFVVSEFECNLFEQRDLEFQLLKQGV